MTEQILEHMANLAIILDANLNYSYELGVDTPSDTYPTLRERHRVSVAGYKTIYRMTFKGILDLTAADFIKE